MYNGLDIFQRYDEVVLMLDSGKHVIGRTMMDIKPDSTLIWIEDDAVYPINRIDRILIRSQFIKQE